MAKVDFSHLFQTPTVTTNTLERGYKVTDENWLGTVARIEPPLFTAAELQDLNHILDPEIERRGGKSIGLLSKPLIVRLREMERPDLPARFVEGLIDRLATGKRYTRRDSDREYGKRLRKFERDRLIVYFYDYIYDRIKDEDGSITHEVFEPIPISRRGRTKAERVLATLHDFLVGQTAIDPPSESTILRLVSEAKGRKRRPRS